MQLVLLLSLSLLLLLSLIDDDNVFEIIMTETVQRFSSCQCGAKACRGVVRGDDYLGPLIRDKYKVSEYEITNNRACSTFPPLLHS